MQKTHTQYPHEHPAAGSHDAERWLQALVDVSRQIANLEALPTVLRSIVTAAMELVSSDLAAIALLNDERSQLELKCFTARQHYTGTPKVCDTVNTNIIIRAVHEGRALRFPQNRLPNETAWQCPLLQQPIVAAAVVPLMLDGTPIGALWVARHNPDLFTPADVAGLSQLADQTVIALEHATMASRIQSIAITQERYRIAREMHDSLAQVLGYLNIQMQTLELLFKAGDSDRVLEELATARQSIEHAQGDVRESILSLRTTLSDDLPLPVALKEYVVEFGLQTGLDVYFHSDVIDTPPITPLANTELVRIVQEALTNVRKHAHARSINVRLIINTNALVIHIVDDGIGFDPSLPHHQHFGLSTMHERAHQIGGRVDVISHAGQGTTVQVEVPLALGVQA